MPYNLVTLPRQIKLTTSGAITSICPIIKLNKQNMYLSPSIMKPSEFELIFFKQVKHYHNTFVKEINFKKGSDIFIQYSNFFWAPQFNRHRWFRLCNAQRCQPEQFLRMQISKQILNIVKFIINGLNVLKSRERKKGLLVCFVFVFCLIYGPQSQIYLTSRHNDSD